MNLSYQKRLKLVENWRLGRYEELGFFNLRGQYPTKLCLERDYLYLNCGGQIRVHRRQFRGHLERRIYKEVGQQKDHEIVCFTKKGSTIFAGRTSGTAMIHCDDEYTEEQRLHKGLINAVDFHDNVFVSTSNENTKVWTMFPELGMYYLEPAGTLTDPYHDLKIDPTGSTLVGGKFKDTEKNALRMHDLET